MSTTSGTPSSPDFTSPARTSDSGPDESGLTSTLTWLVKAGNAAAGVVMILMTANVLVGIAARYLFDAPIAALFEFNEYAMLAITFLAAGLLVRDDENVRLDIAEVFLSDKALRVLTIISEIIVFLVIALVLYGAALQLVWDLRSGATTLTYLAPQRWPLTAIISLGLVFMLLSQLLRVTEAFRSTAPVQHESAEITALDEY